MKQPHLIPVKALHFFERGLICLKEDYSLCILTLHATGGKGRKQFCVILAMGTVGLKLAWTVGKKRILTCYEQHTSNAFGDIVRDDCIQGYVRVQRHCNPQTKVDCLPS